MTKTIKFFFFVLLVSLFMTTLFAVEKTEKKPSVQKESDKGEDSFKIMDYSYILDEIKEDDSSNAVNSGTAGLNNYQNASQTYPNSSVSVSGISSAGISNKNPTVILTLEEAVNSAFEESYALKTAQNNLEKEINNSHVKSYLPVLNASGSVSESADLLHNPGDSLKYPTIRLSTGVTWRLGTTDLLTKSTSFLTLRNAELSLEREMNSIRENVSMGYFNLISLRNQVEQNKSSLEISEVNYKRTQSMYQGSKATKLSLLQAELTYNDSMISYEAALTNYENALTDFRIFTGIEYVFELPEDVDVRNLDYSKLNSLVEQYYQDTVSVKIAQTNVEIAETSNRNTIVNNRIPTVSLQTNLAYNGNKTGNRDFQNSLDFTATVSVSVPLDSYLPWTQANANVKNSKINVDNASVSLESAKKSVKDNARTYINQINTYVSRIKNLDSHLTLAEENYNQTQKAYETGYLSYNELNTAESNLDSARKNVSNNNSSIVMLLCRFAGLLNLDFYTVMDYLKG